MDSWAKYVWLQREPFELPTQPNVHNMGLIFAYNFFFYFMTDDLFGEGTFIFLLLFLFNFLCVSQDNR